MADNIDGIFGGYSPEPDPNYIKTPRQGLSPLGNNHDSFLMNHSIAGFRCGISISSSHFAYFVVTFLSLLLGNKVNFAEGCKDSDTKCTDYNSTSVQQAVSGANLVIVCLGTGALQIQSHSRLLRNRCASN